MGRLIIDGNRIYELDEACLRRKKQSGEQGQHEAAVSADDARSGRHTTAQTQLEQ